MKQDIIFGQDSVTIDGTRWEAGYSVTPGGKVCVFMQADGQTVRIALERDDAHYDAALLAATGGAEQVQDQGASELDAATEAESVREANSLPKSQRPELAHWIGTTIKGKGWRIEFDGGYDRTRVIFKRPPCAGVKALLKDFGFFWSPVLKSWNKGLNCKACRAAEKLAAHLRYYPEKPLFG